MYFILIWNKYSVGFNIYDCIWEEIKIGKIYWVRSWKEVNNINIWNFNVMILLVNVVNLKIKLNISNI